jgi:ABC-type branched-subunit amino acid transport system substrate-binding protein
MTTFRQAFETQQGKIVFSASISSEPAATYSSLLEEVIVAEADVLVCLSFADQAAQYLQEFFDAECDNYIDLLFCEGTKSAQMADVLGAKKLEGYFGTAPAKSSSESSAIFNNDYYAEYAVLQSRPFISNFYDAVVAAGLSAAACLAYGLEPTPGNVRNMLRFVSNPPGEAIFAGIDGLRRGIELLSTGKVINYEGASGSIDFDENGDVLVPIEIWQFSENEPYIQAVRYENPAKTFGSF